MNLCRWQELILPVLWVLNEYLYGPRMLHPASIKIPSISVSCHSLFSRKKRSNPVPPQRGFLDSGLRQNDYPEEDFALSYSLLIYTPLTYALSEMTKTVSDELRRSLEMSIIFTTKLYSLPSQSFALAHLLLFTKLLNFSLVF